MSNQAVVVPASHPDLLRGIQARSKFFLSMSIVLLLTVLTGFARTLYLRPFFTVPPISIHVYAHGLALTGWFVWFVVQTSLVSVGRREMHRRLGVIGLFLGVAVVLTSAMVMAGIAPRLQLLFRDPHCDDAFIYRVVWGDWASLLSFTVLVALGAATRRRPEMHKRFMLLASTSLIGQALGRIALWPVFASIGTFVFSLAGLIFFLGALLAHDLATGRRVHTATLIGGGLRLVLWGGVIVVARTGFGQEIVRGMAFGF